jgi:hypothetical protein
MVRIWEEQVCPSRLRAGENGGVFLKKPRRHDMMVCGKI